MGAAERAGAELSPRDVDRIRDRRRFLGLTVTLTGAWKGKPGWCNPLFDSKQATPGVDSRTWEKKKVSLWEHPPQESIFYSFLFISIKHASEGDKHLYRKAKTVRNHRHIRGLEQGRSKQKWDPLSGAVSVPADASLNGITFICLNRSPPVTGENTKGQGASNSATYSNKNIWEGNTAEVVQRTNRISHPYPFSQQWGSLDK